MSLQPSEQAASSTCPHPHTYSSDDSDVLCSLHLLVSGEGGVGDAEKVFALCESQGNIIAVHQHTHMLDDLGGGAGGGEGQVEGRGR